MTFDTLAPHYRWLEAVLAGGKLQRCRTAFLGAGPEPQRALLAGEGNGRFLSSAAQRWPKTEFIVVDASAGMLAAAETRWRKCGGDPARVRFFRRELPADDLAAGKCDLVATHFFFDCFPPAELGAVIASLARAAAPTATWLVSEFHEPGAGVRRWRAQAILALAYGFFRLATGLRARRVPDFAPALEAHGFRRRERLFFEWDLLRAERWVRVDGAQE